MNKTLSSWILYADGAASGNPGPAGWGALILSPQGHILELAGACARATNNAMELQATLEGLKRIFSIDPHATIEVRTDSQYVIRGITEFIKGWKTRDWKTLQGAPVANLDLWLELDRIGAGLQRWVYVPGHTGFPGNERVDTLAVACSKNESPILFNGNSKDYSIRWETLIAPIPKIKKFSTPVYLSFVAGVLYRDSSWSDCEKRVKGRNGVKFKKVSSQEEEDQTLKNWGV